MCFSKGIFLIVHQVVRQNFVSTTTMDSMTAFHIPESHIRFIESHITVTRRLILREEGSPIGAEVAKHQSDMDGIDIHLLYIF